MKINQNYLSLPDNYLFVRVAQNVREYKEKKPDADIIRLGIGDVTLPLAPVVVEAMEKAVREMGHSDTFRGYEDTNGYDFFKNAVIGYYSRKDVTISQDEVFVSDGAKSDIGNILDIFSSGSTVLIPDPVYPVYVDTNIMAGHKIIYSNGNAENGFLPLPDESVKADIIYLCSPNNPTGAVYTKRQLSLWIDYALENDAVILFDSAYEAFVQDGTLPTSIYQVSGAEKCAIEFCSFSKTAGFTGTRCGYTIVPKELIRCGKSVANLWKRRQNTKFNSVGYIVQRGAEAALSQSGIEQCRENIAYYMENARLIAEALKKLNIWFTGGHNSPYIWLKCPGGLKSWDFFDMLLEEGNIVGTPGAGFGANGEGFFRLTAFGARGSVINAMERLTKMHIFCKN